MAIKNTYESVIRLLNTKSLSTMKTVGVKSLFDKTFEALQYESQKLFTLNQEYVLSDYNSRFENEITIKKQQVEKLKKISDLLFNVYTETTYNTDLNRHSTPAAILTDNAPVITKKAFKEDNNTADEDFSWTF